MENENKPWKTWVVFSDSVHKKILHSITEEDMEALMKFQKGFISAGNIRVNGVEGKDILEFGNWKELDLKHFPPTPPYRKDGNDYGAKTSSQHREFAWVECGRPVYAMITKHLLSETEKMAWKVESKVKEKVDEE